MNQAPAEKERKPSDAWNRSGYWRAFIVTLIISVVAIIALNLLIDPFELYGTGVVSPWKANSYDVKLSMFRDTEPPPGALIIGSSRVELVDPEVVTEITGRKCFNWGLPSAKVETFRAVLRLAVEEEEAPIDILVVSIDPAAFQPGSWIHMQMRLAPEYTRGLVANPERLALREKMWRLMTVEQTRTSCMVLGSRLGLFEFNARTEYYPNGMARYPLWESQVESGDFDLNAILAEYNPAYPEAQFGLSIFTHLSERRMEYWEDILRLCDEKGIELYVYMPPVHPSLREVLVDAGAEGIINEVSGYLDATVTEAGGTYRDFSDLESFAGDPEMFYDGVHMWTENCERMIRELFSEFNETREDREN